METQQQVAGYMCGFDGVQRGNYFGGESIGTKVEVRVGKLRNMKVAYMYQSTGNMVNGGGEMVLT